MKNIIKAFLAISILSMGQSALAETKIEAMVGTWKWADFTIRVGKCDKTKVCAKVVSGPKNVGLQMIQSKLTPADGSFVGKIAHPQTGNTYNSKISMLSTDVWHIDGCTDANVCASGDFKRVQ
ncbi:MAG: DUF2147 domain-containing protein [Gammaproteobacteria bacterium]|nr:DUF2147 domain-containing protein [Gammaproteobacteria bacterium]MCW8987266.1 DUF2147 domain-containing protein [Gammaproteobacteria bacterium]